MITTAGLSLQENSLQFIPLYLAPMVKPLLYNLISQLKVLYLITSYDVGNSSGKITFVSTEEEVII